MGRSTGPAERSTAVCGTTGTGSGTGSGAAGAGSGTPGVGEERGHTTGGPAKDPHGAVIGVGGAKSLGGPQRLVVTLDTGLVTTQAMGA
mmetsp:Transcript_42294/g.91804  ORF Transcript_42294/g.91804 Transcript_42294/m.91804 type:complete len:89 (+) Transcript_42294:957-1223(+)